MSAQPLVSRRENRLSLSLIMWPVIQSIMLCSKSPIKTGQQPSNVPKGDMPWFCGRRQWSSAFWTCPDLTVCASSFGWSWFFVLYNKTVIAIITLSGILSHSRIITCEEVMGFIASWLEMQVTWGPQTCMWHLEHGHVVEAAALDVWSLTLPLGGECQDCTIVHTMSTANQ